MKLAGCMVTQNYDARFGTFPCLQSLSDFTTVLDDNSDSVEAYKQVEPPDELISLYRKPGTLWNDTANRTMLMYRAYLAGCDYVLPWSADVLPSAALYEWIAMFRHTRGESFDHEKPHFFECELREAWDRHDSNQLYLPTYWRSDGVWSEKRNVFMQYNWLADEDIRMPDEGDRLHSYSFPRKQVPVVYRFPANSGCCIYHFGGMTRNQRNARVTKYSVEDSKNEFQKDYTYLQDETGAVLSLIPQEDQDFFKRWMTL